MVAFPRSLTPEEFLALPDDDGPSLEYINGEVHQKVAAKRKHVTVAGYLAYALHDHVRETGGFSGQEPTVAFVSAGDERYLVPDVAYWAPGKPQGDDIFLPPTLAIEARSPDQSVASLRRKCAYYLAHGVDVTWLVNPDRLWLEAYEGDSVRTYRPGDVVETIHPPGFMLSLDEMFSTLER